MPSQRTLRHDSPAVTHPLPHVLLISFQRSSHKNSRESSLSLPLPPLSHQNKTRNKTFLGNTGTMLNAQTREGASEDMATRLAHGGGISLARSLWQACWLFSLYPVAPLPF